MKRLSFRRRVLLYLVLFAVVPSSALMLGGAVVVGTMLPVLSGRGAWANVAATGQRAIAAVRRAPLTPEQRRLVRAHEQELAASLTQARRYSFLMSRAVVLVAVFALLGSVLLALLASRVAAHLSRQLSRPLDELVGWTELIARGKPLPDVPPRRGAPEFEVLRRRMRKMARDLHDARERALEAERLEAFREMARRVAHELKNPLTPMRFAIERLRRDADPRLTEVVEVLSTESQRLETMARSFSQFGTLPEGPPADVDLGELACYTARSTVPDHLAVTVDVEDGVPLIRGHQDALARALSNVLINAVEACQARERTADGQESRVHVRVARTTDDDGHDGVELCVSDTGCGIPAAMLDRIWEPYATNKAGGTGLGLAIVRQTVLAHHGNVAATSVEGGGTNIRFIFPTNEHAAERLSSQE
ncbi:MAG TPA: HAMP domain-containing sensor histidine kinase [Gemmatimonadaceae bacterium]|nr:HAMP domain-containing sensor histidine kinase [Gemmatimonadaceae bacterium]